MNGLHAEKMDTDDGDSSSEDSSETSSESDSGKVAPVAPPINGVSVCRPSTAPY